MPAPWAPILARDLRRLSRRLSLRIPRVAIVFIFTLVLAIAVSLGLSGRMVIEDISRVSEVLWVGVTLLCFALATVLVPLEVGQAISAEREEGTLDLLTLVGLPPGRVLFQIIGVRVLSLGLLFLSTVPLLYLGLSLGGISPAQVVVFGVALTVFCLALLGVASLVATATRGVAVPMVLSAVWVLVFLVFLPLRFLRLSAQWPSGFDWRSSELYSPLKAVYGDILAYGWLGLGFSLWVSAGLFALLVARWRFVALVAQGGASCSKAWPGARGGWALAALIVAAGWGLMELGEDGALLLQDLTTLTDFSSWPVAELIFLVVWPLAQGLYLRAAVWLLPRLERSSRRRRRLGPALISTFGPLLWRELFTRAQGPLSRLVWILSVGWVLIAIPITLISAPRFEEALLWGLFGFYGGWIVLSVLVSSSVVDERQRRGLPLLTLSGVGPNALVFHKALAGVLRVGPLLLLSYLPVLVIPLVERDVFRRISFGNVPFEQIAFMALSGLGWLLAATVMFAAGSAALAFAMERRSFGLTAPPLFAVCFYPSLLLAVLLAETVSHQYGRYTSVIVAPFMGPFNLSRYDKMVLLGLGLWIGAAILACLLAAYQARRRMASGKA